MIEIQLSTQTPYQAEADVLVVLTSSARKQGALRGLDKRLNSQLFPHIKHEQFEAKKGQTLGLSTLGQIKAPRLLLAGLGEEGLDDLTHSRKAGASALRGAQSWNPGSIAIAIGSPPKDLSDAIHGLALGIWLASYRFDLYKSNSKDAALESVTLLLPSRTPAATREKLAAALQDARVLAESILAARDLVNEPPNTLTPAEFANRAALMSEEVGLDCKIYGPDQLREWGMNLFLAVSVGSSEEPRLIHMHYKPKRRKRKNAKVVALVGKGVTFDSGGLSLKPTPSMVGMHADMAGAAAVFGAMQAIAQLKPNVEVHGFIGATENMTGAAAYKINDIIESYNGKFVEIKNTDAEGRLVLADTIAYAAEQENVTHIINAATLTGACVVALGSHTAAVMSNQQTMANDVLKAAENAGESMWQLPLLEELRPQLKSHTADFTNVGGRWGGAITAGLFLREFVPKDMNWTHLDIAGPSFADGDKHHITKGGTGFGVATMVEFCSK